MTILLISLVWLALLAALVYRLATRPERVMSARKRSPRLLDEGRPSFEQVISESLQMTPAAGSKPATAEHVGDRTQEDLYVRP
jgi:hypothetical protein